MVLFGLIKCLSVFHQSLGPVSVFYKYVFCFILTNKLKSDLEGSESNPISHAYCVSQHSERVLGSSPGRVMGREVNEEKHMMRRGLKFRTYHRLRGYSDALAIGPQGTWNTLYINISDESKTERSSEAVS